MISTMAAVLLKCLRALATAWLIVGATLLLLVVFDRALAALLPALSGYAPIDSAARARPLREADALKGQPWVELYERERAASKEMRWVAYRYWQRAPFSGQTINIDARGVRLTVQNANPGARQIWMFGGSTLWGTGTPDASTLPSLLARELAPENVEISNFGESGYVSTQSLWRLMELLKSGARPDWVIFYDGANEVFSSLQNGVAGLPQNEANRRLEFNVLSDGGQSARLVLNGFSGFKRVLAKPASVPDVVALAEQTARDYEANLRLLNGLSVEFGFKVLALWQPVIFTKKALSSSEQDELGSSAQVHRDLWLQTRKRLRLAPLSTLGWVDLSTELDAETAPLYLDFCHLGPHGNALVARGIAREWRATN